MAAPTSAPATRCRYAQNSPHVAVCLAAYMGAGRIGLIGVDLTDHHFFGATGRHPLASRVREIDEQYRRLAGALAARGVELVNLSAGSRLTSLPKTLAASLTTPSPSPADDAAGPSTAPIRRVFFVHYQFLSCGDVFTRGLENAARDLGLEWASASCEDAGLVEAVHRFRPELLFVVHGRRFRQRWNERFRSFRRAVWLLDEPYEVARRSPRHASRHGLRQRSVDDRRHSNAHYLPCAWDPHARARPGRGTPLRRGLHRRETDARSLPATIGPKLLSYLVGGPWQSSMRKLVLVRTCLRRGRRSVPPDASCRERLSRSPSQQEEDPATSLNPRVYEALACALSCRRTGLSCADVSDVPSFAMPAAWWRSCRSCSRMATNAGVWWRHRARSRATHTRSACGPRSSSRLPAPVRRRQMEDLS